MKTNIRTTLVALGTALIATVVTGDSAAAANCKPKRAPLAAVTRDSATMRRLLKAEELVEPSSGTMALTPVELDGDKATEEGFITLLSPEHCHLSGCIGIVVQRQADGTVRSLGHGRSLSLSGGKSQGHANLLATHPTTLGKLVVLRYCYGRYRAGECATGGSSR